MTERKLPTPADVARAIPTVMHVGRTGYVGKPQALCLEEGARAMAEAIRDALRESSKAHERRDGGSFLRASWALRGFADLIDDSLRDSPPKE